MPLKYLLAIDQGTTGTHVSLVDSKLRLAGSSYCELRQHFPKPGWVEHDLGEIWSSVESCISKAIRDAHIRPQQISGIGITNQRETTGLWWRRSGKPLHRAIVWQDRRTAPDCADLKQRGVEDRVRSCTGLVLDPYFSGTKLQWLLEHLKDARRQAESGELCFGTIDTWLVYKLTGSRVHVTDTSNASRTLLMNLRTLAWDPEMCSLLAVPIAALPQIRSSAEIYGHTLGLRSLPDGIPIAGMAGDQQSALFGQACFAPGDAKCTYGTGAFLLMNTGESIVESRNGLLTTVAWTLNGKTTYALEGSCFVAGAAVQWLRWLEADQALLGCRSVGANRQRNWRCGLRSSVEWIGRTALEAGRPRSDRRARPFLHGWASGARRPRRNRVTGHRPGYGDARRCGIRCLFFQSRWRSGRQQSADAASSRLSRNHGGSVSKFANHQSRRGATGGDGNDAVAERGGDSASLEGRPQLCSQDVRAGTRALSGKVAPSGCSGIVHRDRLGAAELFVRR